MKHYFLLTKILFKCDFGSFSKGSKISLRRPFLAVLLVLMILPAAAVVFFISYTNYATFSEAGAGLLMIEIIMASGAAMTFAFGLPMILSVFYMTSDIGTLLAFPLSPDVIVASKWTVSLLYEYLMVLIFAAPFLAGYGAASHGGPVFWICMAAACLLLPMQPLIYAGIVAMIFMRIFKRVRNKQILTTAAFIFTMIIAVGLVIFIQVLFREMQNADTLIDGGGGSVVRLSWLFPNLTLLDRAIYESSVPYLLLYLLTLAGLFVLFLLIARRIYREGAVGLTDITGNGRPLTENEILRYQRTGNPMFTYMHVEMKKLLRTPVWFFNCVLMDIIWPVLFVIPAIGMYINYRERGGGAAAGSAASGVAGTVSGAAGLGAGQAAVRVSRAVSGAAGLGAGQAAVQFSSAVSGAAGLGAGQAAGGFTISGFLRLYAGKPATLAAVLAAVLVLTFLLASLNLTTATSISREGKGIAVMKSIPMAYSLQLRAKALCGAILTLIATCPYFLIIFTVGVFFGMSPLVYFFGLLTDVFITVLTGYIQLFFDLAFPKLIWENEAVPVKQNLHSAAAVFISLFLAVVFLAVGAFLYLFLHAGVILTATVLVIILAAAAFLIRLLVLFYGESRMKEII